MLYLNYVCKYFREIQIRFIVIYVIKIGRRRTINKEDMLPLSMQKVLKNKRWNGKFVNTSLTRFTTRSTDDHIKDSQKKLPETPTVQDPVPEAPPISATSESDEIEDSIATVQRRSSRKRQSYDTQRDDDEEMECVICKTDKRDGKGRKIPITLITLRDVSFFDADTTIHVYRLAMIFIELCQ